MECSDVCKVCPRLVISQAVTFDAGTLTINLPAEILHRGCAVNPCGDDDHGSGSCDDRRRHGGLSADRMQLRAAGVLPDPHPHALCGKSGYDGYGRHVPPAGPRELRAEQCAYSDRWHGSGDDLKGGDDRWQAATADWQCFRGCARMAAGEETTEAVAMRPATHTRRIIRIT